MATVDRLSDLPDDIIHNILALLPIDDSVRTSVLSSRWSRLYSTNPALNFSSERFDEGNIISLVDHCLILSSPIRKLRSVRFPVHRHPDMAAALRRWIHFAADRDVEEVVISPLLVGYCSVEIPRALFECRSLSSLKLQKCSLLSVPLPAEEGKLKFLKTVVLAYVEVGNDALTSILSLCPMIETLALSRCRGFSQIVVSSPTMMSLTVNNCDDLNQFQVVWAPRLSRFMYDGDISNIKSMEAMENLEEAAILSSRSQPSDDFQQWKRSITALAHVKVLSVNNWFFEFPLKAAGESGNKIIFYNIKEFHWWHVCKKFGVPWSASVCDLLSALKHCPALELLCMHCDYYYLENEYEEDNLYEYMGEAENEDDDYLGAYIGEAENEDDEYMGEAENEDDDYLGAYIGVEEQEQHESNQLRKLNKAKGLLTSLKRLKVVDFSCKKNEFQLIEFVLSKALQLETVILYYVPEEAEKLEEMRWSIDKLPKVSRRASVSLSELQFDACPKHENMWWQFMML